MSRAMFVLQLLIGWTPAWALFVVLLHVAHPGTSWTAAMLIATRLIATAALLALAVHALTARLPWPYPFRIRFVLAHTLAALAYAVAWMALNSLIESLIRGRVVLALGPGLQPYLVMGIWLYVMVAGIAYANRAAARRAEIEALAARTRLAALRQQLNPHFLFNALHTVVQLIPLDPARASRAAEQLAELLRRTLEHDRDAVSLQREWEVVQRYLALESLRFGERLRVQADVPAGVLDASLPAFALQSLVENAVRHGAAPRTEATTVAITARREHDALLLRVHDDGAGFAPSDTTGSGLRRLRERLQHLYGAQASLQVRRGDGGGCEAVLRLPWREAAEDGADDD